MEGMEKGIWKKVCGRGYVEEGRLREYQGKYKEEAILRVWNGCIGIGYQIRFGIRYHKRVT